MAATADTAVEVVRSAIDRARDKLATAIAARIDGDITPAQFDVEINRFQANTADVVLTARKFTEDL